MSIQCSQCYKVAKSWQNASMIKYVQWKAQKILSRYLRLWFALVHLRIVKLNILGGRHVQYIPPGKSISHLVGTKWKKESMLILHPATQSPTQCWGEIQWHHIFSPLKILEKCLTRRWGRTLWGRCPWWQRCCRAPGACASDQPACKAQFSWIVCASAKLVNIA